MEIIPRLVYSCASITRRLIFSFRISRVRSCGRDFHKLKDVESTEGATARKRSGKRTTASVPLLYVIFIHEAGKLTLESDHDWWSTEGDTKALNRFRQSLR